MGIGGSVLYILTPFLSNRWTVNMHNGCADDSTLVAVVPSPGVRVTVGESLSSDLVKVSECCGILRMKLNASNTKTMCVQVTRINCWRKCAE